MPHIKNNRVGSAMITSIEATEIALLAPDFITRQGILNDGAVSTTDESLIARNHAAAVRMDSEAHQAINRVAGQAKKR